MKTTFLQLLFEPSSVLFLFGVEKKQTVCLSRRKIGKETEKQVFVWFVKISDE
jgi:hypothetical protein